MSGINVSIIRDNEGPKCFQLDISETRPGFTKDNKRTVKIPFPRNDDKDSTLEAIMPSIPDDKPSRYYLNTELIWLAQYHGWVAFNLISVPDAPYNDERIDGPYLAPDLPSATSDECRAAAIKKDFVRRLIDYYSPHQVCPKCRAII